MPEPAIVVLGAPGCGKSTLLRHFELENAQNMLARLNGEADSSVPQFTFFLSLNSYKPARSGDALPLPKDWIAERWGKDHPDLPALESLLQQQRITLLLDALNEIPAARAEAIGLWKDFLCDLARDYPGNRMIFSCRTLDYSAWLSSKELRVPQPRIDPLSDGQVRQFIDAYCPDHGAALWRNLENTPQLEMLRVPYFLKLLIEQTQGGNVPAGRAALFNGFVRQALKREVEGDNPLFQPGELLQERDTQWLIQASGSKMPFKLPEVGVLIPKLSRLAYRMQSEQTAGEGGQVRIGYDEALAFLEHGRDEDIVKAGVAIGVLEHDLEPDPDEVLYIHQLLQEYFAARELAKSPQPQLVRQPWQADQVAPSLQDTLAKLADSDPLPPLPGSGWEETTLLAAAMAKDPARFVTELMESNLPLAGRCAAQPEVRLALGELGDPRFERRAGPCGEYLLPPLIDIPGGVYSIGSDEGLLDEAPMHPVKLKPFRIGKFPVTNGEWALFMKAGGYDEERWWDTEEAQAWRRGESTAEGPKQQWREDRKQFQVNFDRIRALHQEKRITSKQADDWEAIARMGEAEFEALLDGWHPSGPQTQPAYWNDDAFNNPAQPAVGVCWHEARAYCAWLSVQTGQPFRLPTEAEWEAAASGQRGRRYAYGNDFDASRCNAFETHIRRATPIGVFPGGETPEGLVDMTGNIWDWTSSLYKNYRYDAGDGRESIITGDGHRVVRGGSWFSSQGLARATVRNRAHPDLRSFDIGFRVVCSSPIL